MRQEKSPAHTSQKFLARKIIMDNINKKHKDRLFRLLFGDERYKQNTLDLYNALNETKYDDLGELVFDTIEDVIYMGMKNDASFIIHSWLNVYEQQSTFNPNMPIRGLMYLGKLYDKYIKENDLNIYGKVLQKLPTPQYIVFYNGTELEYQDKDVFELKLTDAFEFGKEKSCVELTAAVYNINFGHNAKLMEACKALSEYAQFVNRVRDFIKDGLSTEEAVDRAVDECIEEDILIDVLLANKAEVKDMVLTEYNEAKTMRDLYNEGWNDGRNDGWNDGWNDGRNAGRNEERDDCVKKIAANYIKNGLASSMEEAVEKATALLS